MSVDCTTIGVRRLRKGRPRPAWLIAALALAGSVLAAAPARGYELGMGYPLPWLGIVAGGYATLRAGDLEDISGKAALEDLSLFLSGPIRPRWRYFTELELGDPVVWQDGGPTIADGEFHVERLYLDHNLTPRTTLRLGKFLTPVGRWNLIHAEPLVWSIFRPLTTASAFPRNANPSLTPLFIILSRSSACAA